MCPTVATAVLLDQYYTYRHQFVATTRDMLIARPHCHYRRVEHHGIPGRVSSPVVVGSLGETRYIQENAIQPLQQLVWQSCHILSLANQIVSFATVHLRINGSKSLLIARDRQLSLSVIAGQTRQYQARALPDRGCFSSRLQTFF